jgi:trk/ktr system potassium uptake protein
MKIVILGCGRVGAMLTTLMVNEHHDVTIIDQNSESFERLGQEYRNRVHTVVGDGIDEDVLRKAGIESADAFAAVTNGDNRNIMSAQIAKYRFKVPRVICRIYDPIRQQTYKALGLESISPTIVGAKLMKDALLSSTPSAGTSTRGEAASGVAGAATTR